MVSPSRIETTGPVKSAALTAETATNRSARRMRLHAGTSCSVLMCLPNNVESEPVIVLG